MKLFSILTLLGSIALTPISATTAAAQNPSLIKKLNAYVDCINRLSARAHDSRARYFSWADYKGPTGKERIIYGVYTIYDTSDCRKKVEIANALEPRIPDLEAAASAYAEAVGTLEPVLKETDDYYTQQDYKDDKMAKGKALHTRLLFAWEAFGKADKALSSGVEVLRDKLALDKLAEIEQKEGRKARYYVDLLMIQAKNVMRTMGGAKPNIGEITKTLSEYEETVKATEQISGEGDQKIGSFFIGSAKSYLTTSKQLMRRIRDKTPYSSGDKMMMNGGGAWMVEGSPARLLKDYNELVQAYNRGSRI